MISYSWRGISERAKCFRGISGCSLSLTPFPAFCNELGMCQRALDCLIFFLNFWFGSTHSFFVALCYICKKKKKKKGPLAYMLFRDLFLSFNGEFWLSRFKHLSGLKHETAWVCISVLLLTSCVTSNKLPDTAMPLFHHLQNRDEDSILPIRSLWERYKVWHTWGVRMFVCVYVWVCV